MRKTKLLFLIAAALLSSSVWAEEIHCAICGEPGWRSDRTREITSKGWIFYDGIFAKGPLCSKASCRAAMDKINAKTRKKEKIFSK